MLFACLYYRYRCGKRRRRRRVMDYLFIKAFISKYRYTAFIKIIIENNNLVGGS
jgi:hypothetical protein